MSQQQITVADLVHACATQGVDPAEAVLFIERDVPIPAVEADVTVAIGPCGMRVFGFLLDAPYED